MSQRILLVEDDARIRELVSDYLQSQGFEVASVADGTEAVVQIAVQMPDLVVLDWMLPGEDGLSVCRKAREASYRGPILMLTARSDEIDEIVALEVGVDDFLSKPVRPRLLLARVNALLRRAVDAAPAGADDRDDRVVLGDLVVDSAQRSVTVSGQPVELTTAEFDLLWYLASNAGTPLTRDDLFMELRGIEYDGLDRSMDMRVSTVRRRLESADPQGRDWIKTVRGVGYQMVRA
jgi:two-component system response regulator RstA